MKKTKVKNLILIFFATAFLLLLTVGSFVKPDTDFSPNENRYFQSTPKFSIKNVLSGKYESQAEDYLSDQVIFREAWINIKSRAQYILGIRDINGVYVCKSGRIIEKVTDDSFNWKQYESNLKQVADLKERINKDADFKVMLVPTAEKIYEGELPKGALVYDEDKAFNIAEKYFDDSLINISKEMKAFLTIEPERTKEESLYYYTDHHWTDAGVRIGYKAFNKAKGLDKNYTVTLEKLTEDFQGTLFSKVLINKNVKDEISTTVLAKDLKVKAKLGTEDADSILKMERLNEKDKYQVFFGGNYDIVDLEITENEGKDSILILKDSYANAFVPYLLADYSHITMVDTRYYRGDVEDLASNYDEILVLYSINNFAGEKIKLN